MKNCHQKEYLFSLSRSQAIAFRLAKHHLRSSAEGIHRDVCDSEPGQSHTVQTQGVSRTSQIAQVAGAISGVQAQVASAASLALRARIRGLWPQEVADALRNKRDLVKIWCMRATLHYLPSEDLPLYIAGVGPGIALKEQRWMAKDGLDLALLERMVDVVVEALADGPLTRREIGSRVVARVGEQARPWVERSWGGVIKQASLRGLVCFGPEQGREVTFVRLDQWLPGFKGICDPDERVLARADVMARYLGAYGPATVQDFAFWSGLPVKDASEACDVLGDRVVDVVVGGKQALIMQEDLEMLMGPAPGTVEHAEGTITSRHQHGLSGVSGQGLVAHAERTVNLLASFDPYLLGHRDKTHLVQEAHYKKIFRKAGWISPVILVDGKVVGTWDYTRAGKRLRLTLQPFDAAVQNSSKLTQGSMNVPCELEPLLEEEIDDVRRFLGFEHIEVVAVS